MFIHSACLGVDTFLLISGLLTVYTVSIYQDGVKFNLIMFYIHRYLRLTPVFAVVILIHATLLKFLGSGPLWYGAEQHLMESCRSLWWWALLYIQNYSGERIFVSTLHKTKNLTFFLTRNTFFKFVTSCKRKKHNIARSV